MVSFFSINWCFFHKKNLLSCGLIPNDSLPINFVFCIHLCHRMGKCLDWQLLQSEHSSLSPFNPMALFISELKETNSWHCPEGRKLAFVHGICSTWFNHFYWELFPIKLRPVRVDKHWEIVIIGGRHTFLDGISLRNFSSFYPRNPTFDLLHWFSNIDPCLNRPITRTPERRTNSCFLAPIGVW